MKKTCSIMLLLTTLVAPAWAGSANAPKDLCKAHSSELLDALAKDDFKHAGTHFNASVAGALGSGKLQQVWTQVQGQFGDYQKHDVPAWQTMAGQRVLVTRLSFAHAPLDALIACDADGAISTFRLVPAASHSKGEGEKPLAITSPLGPLPGIMTLPKGEGLFPAVLLVVGSGPQDADETIGPNKPFRDLAQGLAAAGIASLRYDKRTRVYASQMKNTAITVDDEVTADALTALKLLGQQPHIASSRVFVLGHSLGGMVAPRIARRDAQVAGLIMLAAPARPLLQVSAGQVRELGKRMGASNAQTAETEQAIADERKLLAHADPKHPPGGSFSGVPQSYWTSLHDYHQVAVAKTLTVPMLILQGGDDFQVSPKSDFGRWQQALKSKATVRFHRYPGLNHLFMPAGKSATRADYNVPGHVDVGVIADIAQWIKAQSAR